MKLPTISSLAACLIILSTPIARSQSYGSTAIARIIEEETNRSHAMKTLSYLSNIIGTRLIGSNEYMKAVKWTLKQMDSIGMGNVHVEGWGAFGLGQELKLYNAEVMGQQNFPLHSHPQARSPSLTGIQTAEVFYLKADSLQDLAKYEGKLDGTSPERYRERT
ncbi:MAG: hypothetical protein M1339_03280 [Bacteroidetes bacterium]|nr:hypothetical protein [Bacteroidota bacterium]